jgi:hypothetical protein
MKKIIFGILIIQNLNACLLNDAEKAQYAREAYYKDMHSCVENNSTKESIDACREGVKRRWGK